MAQTEQVSIGDNPIVAYVAPFALFMILGAAESWEALAGYYPWVYTVKIFLVLATWWSFHRRYPVYSSDGLGLAVLVGVAGVAVWIALSELKLETALESILPSWIYSGERAGYNPLEAIDSLTGRWVFIAIRLSGLAIVVPLMEEVFWRGFLIRYLISEQFEGVPLGKFTPLSFAAVTVCFAAVHPEILAALVWCAAINALFYRTKNLWACIVAHAVTNLLLGIYVLTSGSWNLW